jgi:hypothetical protein
MTIIKNNFIEKTRDTTQELIDTNMCMVPDECERGQLTFYGFCFLYICTSLFDWKLGYRG